jgi:diguanylate cyclase (GGDEF)-like protein
MGDGTTERTVRDLQRSRAHGPVGPGRTLGLIRLRFMLAAVLIAVAPLTLAVTALGLNRWTDTPGEALVALLALMLLLVVVLTIWLARRVLHSAEALEVSRSELRRLYEAARADSLVDALTGLGNHRAFQEEFERQVAYSRRHRTPFALLLLDLDEFKLTNDGLGHAAGDDVLAYMGMLIRTTGRQIDRAFRIGGDEFAVLLPGSDENDAYSLARRLLASSLQPRPEAEVSRPVSFSGGISAAPELGTGRRQIYAQADAALYWCKRHGRTTVEVYDAERHGAVDQGPTGEISATIAEVIQRRALRPVYQPIIELSTGRVAGWEGLVRPAADSGFADPGAMFVAAEAVGRTMELDEAALEAVARGVPELPGGTFLSMNISPRTLEAPEFTVPRLLRLLERWELQPQQIVLELTERQGVEDLERLRRRVEACREAGLRVAADDVGAGNAGLRLLSEIRFDMVKIDLSLVQGGAMRPASMDILRSIAALAGRWQAYLVAEGVESQEQLQTVRSLHMDAAQGYLLGRPADAMEARRLDLDAMLANDYWVKELLRTAGVSGAAGPH